MNAPSSTTIRTPPPLIFSEVRKSYGETEILKGVTLTLNRGERTALLGSNGSGKSTLLRLIPRITAPTGGEIHVLGKELQHLSRKELKLLRAHIGFVFQKHLLVPRLSALTNTVHGALGRTSFGRAWFHSLAPQPIREEALACLEKVGLANHALKQTRHLSGGQSQRVAIARALMQRPELIIADEPVASLDPESGENVMRLLGELSQTDNLSLLFSTHHLEHALNYADRIVGLSSGRIIFDKRSDQTSLEELRSFYE
ncbi:phosphonate ABC transporter ATP-binding protein [bacterium]|nr:phosphonate ABC transporter ATP-binding protein [bacterium]